MAQPPEKSSDNNIKILSVVWYKVLPPKFGGQKAVALFNEHLGQKTEVFCLCSKENAAIPASYKIFPLLPKSKLQFLNPFVWIKIYRFAKRLKITHLILEFPYHGIAGFICQKLLKVKLVVNTHNIEYRRFKEQKKWWWGLLYHFEKWALNRCNAVLFKTEEDRQMATHQFGLKEKKLEVIPYGVTEQSSVAKNDAQVIIRQKHHIDQGDYILLFAGTLDYAPNADALQSITENIIPLLNQQSLAYKIIVCGRNNLKQFQHLSRIKDPRLIFSGEVDDIELYFKSADVFINSVVAGGGIQTKIMDALSHHLNVVCFISKRIGIEHADNKIFSAADGNWNEFVNRIVEAIKTNEPTPSSFFETYNWRTIADKAYNKILNC